MSQCKNKSGKQAVFTQSETDVQCELLLMEPVCVTVTVGKMEAVTNSMQRVQSEIGADSKLEYVIFS